MYPEEPDPPVTAASLVPEVSEVMETQLRTVSDVFCTHVLPESTEV